jgi:hypothetical protein
MDSAAMSARNWVYDLSASELADWAEGIQAQNHGASPRNRRSLYRAACDAIDYAAYHVTDPVIDKIEQTCATRPSNNKSRKIQVTAAWLTWMMSAPSNVNPDDDAHDDTTDWRQLEQNH